MKPIRCDINSVYLLKRFRVICLFICMNFHSNKGSELIPSLIPPPLSSSLQDLQHSKKNTWVGVLRFQVNNKEARRNHSVY